MSHVTRTPGSIPESWNGLELVDSDPPSRSHAGLYVPLMHSFSEVEKITKINRRRKSGELEVDGQFGATDSRVLPGRHINLK
jgi:hypothetical protein